MSVERIVLGLGLRGAPSAIGLAAELAQTMRVDLLGRFVEDIDLLRFAALPFAREVSYPGSGSRRVDPLAMARALRADAEAARKALQANLSGRPVNWAFEVVRGAVLTQWIAESRRGDLVVAPLAPTLTGPLATLLTELDTRRVSLLLVREPVPGRDGLAILAGADAPGASCAALAAFAARQRGPVNVLALGVADSARPAWEVAMDARLATAGLTARYVHLPEDSASPQAWLAGLRPGIAVALGRDAIERSIVADLGARVPALLLLGRVDTPDRMAETSG